jgi:hypothetical protein
LAEVTRANPGMQSLECVDQQRGHHADRRCRRRD